MSGELAFELPGSGQTVSIRSLSVEHVDMLASNKAVKGVSDILAERIVPECLQIDPAQYAEFLDGDEVATLLALRKVTWGKMFNYQMDCPYCAETAEYTVNLDDLDIKYLDPEQPLKELEYEILDDEGKLEHLLTWHIPRVKERIEKDNDLRKHVRSIQGAQNYQITFSVAYRIDDIQQPKTDGSDEMISLLTGLSETRRKEKIQNFVKKQGARFAQEFLADIEEYGCGYDTAINHECHDPDCGKSFLKELPVTDDFFLMTKESLLKQKSQQRRGRMRAPWKTKKETSTKTDNSPEKMNGNSKPEKNEEVPTKTQEAKTKKTSSTPDHSSKSPSSSSSIPLSHRR